MKLKNAIKVGIVGASGYSGEELIRLLLKHPECKIEFITSRKYNGMPIGEVFSCFAKSVFKPIHSSKLDRKQQLKVEHNASCNKNRLAHELKFISPNIAEIKKAGVDLVFLALPHGLASEYAIPLLESGLKIVDMSADFRLNSAEKYKEYYSQTHPAPELLSEAVYGLPELYREKIKSAQLVACPGCYPTSVILPLAPLLKEKLISTDGIVISSGSGVSGAGRKVDLPYIYPECNESFRAYAVSDHRHLPELEQELAIIAEKSEIAINFIPHLVPMSRGINSTLVLTLNCSDYAAISNAYEKYYVHEPFVRMLSQEKLADTKHVVMSNICEIGYVVDKRTNKLIITSAIDNLTKGAAGQAIQCMNIMCDLDERLGVLP